MRVRLLMLVFIRPFRGLGRKCNYLYGPNPHPPRTQPLNPEQTQPIFIIRSTLTGPRRPAPHLRMLTHVPTLYTCLPAGSSPLPRPGAPGLPSPAPQAVSCRGWARCRGHCGAQALISTWPASSCSRIMCTPVVRSVREALRERPGELGARGGDVCVRPAAGERAGERG